jgi:hypothetical protein
MPQRTEDQASRAALLREAYLIGKDAAKGPSPEQVAEDFKRLYPEDRELVHEFMRGMREQSAGHRSYEGVLVEHGRAKYKDDPRAKLSYYVTLSTPKGDKTVWGVDLERAVLSSGLQVGESIRLAFSGSQDVTVETNILDGDGNVIGSQPITTPRNTWTATKAEGADMRGRPVSNYSPQTMAAPKLSFGSGGATSGAGMLGSSGLNGLKSLFSFGGSRVNAKVADYSQQRVELDLADALRSADKQIGKLKESGLAPLADGSVDAATKAELVKTFLADPQNEGRITDFAKHLDSLSDLAEIVMAKAVGKGSDGPSASRKAIDPIKGFMKEHESMLKALQVDDKSLYERLGGVVQHLMKALSNLLERVGAMFAPGSGAPVVSGPRMT